MGRCGRSSRGPCVRDKVSWTLRAQGPSAVAVSMDRAAHKSPSFMHTHGFCRLSAVTAWEPWEAGGTSHSSARQGRGLGAGGSGLGEGQLSGRAGAPARAVLRLVHGSRRPGHSCISSPTARLSWSPHPDSPRG